MQPTFIDTHAHLDFPEFEADREAVVERAEAAGIDRIITIGTTFEGSQKAVAIAERFPNVYAAVGWHPSYVTSAPQELSAEFKKLAEHPKVVAIGEAGLDYSHLPNKNGGTSEDDARYKARQRAMFEQQIQLAISLGLNMIIHQRDSFQDALEVLRPFASKLRTVFHCFVGNPAEAEKVREMGSLVSFTGIATFKNAPMVRETVLATPLGEFMLETDCPFLAPVPYRGKRCEPAYVADIARFIAREKQCSLEELSARTNETAEKFFPKMRNGFAGGGARLVPSQETYAGAGAGSAGASPHPRD
jgi:TatD DNase family protein